ncbi:GNAT family N-acetyltransferase [Clostridium sp. YIM B02551]|uniref:GNAT family N-acetyltransferase n=1 Tax=Clostridium sp. YIM B02551 TaxID=2910679 RepID=UPI001EEBE04B|nr:GNAT family N-acetyltransferase [Clostridium sp. YIM B02551]
MSNITVRALNNDEMNLWDSFVETSPQGNIFNKKFWLDAVCSNFEIYVAEENGKIVGGIVVPNIKNRIYSMPKLTPQLGILLGKENDNIKYNKLISRGVTITSDLINILPKKPLQLEYNFSVNYTNMLPFIWNGYNVNLKYTYKINDTSDLKVVYDNFDYGIKSEIKKAMGKNIRVSEEYSIEDFYRVNNLTFERQNAVIPYSLEFIKKLDETLKENNCRKMLFAVNELDEIVAGVYLIYDKDTTYYLMGGADPDWRKFGVQSLLVWEAIKFSSEINTAFDFEGSMVPSIENYFRKFGGTQTPIYSINKANKIYDAMYSFGRKHKNTIRKFLKSN